MKIGRYEIGGTLGRGAMGVVYRGRAPSGEEVAIKVLEVKDPERVARFDRERRLLADLAAGGGFVPLVEGGVAEHGPYLVMPLVAGGTLRERLVRGPLSAAETLALGRSLAVALGRAHARGIVHRDLKPENILFTAAGEPLVADLGIAKHFDRLAAGSQSVSLSQEGAFRGTAGYMAPEQARDFKTAGPRADVFALGAILYECLAGRPAFEGETVLDLVGKIDNGTYERLRRGTAPRALGAAIERALRRDPEARFADANELLAALSRRASSRLPVLAVAVLAALGVGVAFALRMPSPEAKEDPLARALATKDVEESARLLGAVIERNPEDVPARVARARARFLLMLEARELGEPVAALEIGVRADLSAALGRDASSAPALMLACHLAVTKGDVPGAMAVLRRIPQDGSEEARYATFALGMSGSTPTVAATAALVSSCPTLPLAALEHENALEVAGREADSLEAMERLAALFPAPAILRTVVTRSLAKGDLERADRNEARWRAAWPRSPLPDDTRAQSALRRGAPAEAIVRGRRMLVLGAEAGAAHVARGLLASGRPEAAIAEATSALATAKLAVVRAALFADRARARIALRDFRGATSDTVAAVREHAGATDYAAPLAAVTELAERWIEDEGASVEAALAIDQVRALDGGQVAEIDLLRSRVSVAVGILGEADAELAQARTRAPNSDLRNPELEAAWARVNERLAALDKAAASGDEDARVKRALTLFEAGAGTNARREVERILASDAPARPRGRAEALLAIAPDPVWAQPILLRALDRSAPILEKAADLAPDDAWILAGRALLDAVNKRGELARRGSLEAVRVAPEDAFVRSLRAEVLLALDEPGEAEAEAERAVALDPSCVEAHMVRSRSARALGDPAREARDLRAWAKVVLVPLEAHVLERRADFKERR